MYTKASARPITSATVMLMRNVAGVRVVMASERMSEKSESSVMGAP